ncbi:MAG: AIR carboxylase family protein [Candidatus Sungbacteria bacterium]|nr:AIR carboxylase family protein [Candidatus Sungbacteria bacterium]
MSTRGLKLTEGKTKIIYGHGGERGFVEVFSKDDITAGDGEKHDVIEGKGALSNRMASNVFRLLKQGPRIPVAFERQLTEESFIARHCAMLPLEVVVRRRAFGSYVKRNPHVPEGMIFPRLILEFFLKTTGKQYEGMTLPKDDPFIRFSTDGVMNLYQPDKPVGTAWGTGELSLPESLEFGMVGKIQELAPYIFLVLERAFRLAADLELVDFKLEFGVSQGRNLYLADVVTIDEMRLLQDGRHESKEAYRKGGRLDMVRQIYERVAVATDRFAIFPPRQHIIVWCGSDKDNPSAFGEALKGFGLSAQVTLHYHVRSMHKEPMRGCRELTEMVQHMADPVVIAFVGRSNGAGPTLAGNTHVPVITVPAGWEKFPEDIWSSLRAPSDVPVLTCLTPENAVLAAANILGARNPFAYAELRTRLERRLPNMFDMLEIQ